MFLTYHFTYERIRFIHFKCVWITCYIYNVVNLRCYLKCILTWWLNRHQKITSYNVICTCEFMGSQIFKNDVSGKASIDRNNYFWSLSSAYTMNNKNWANLFCFWLILILNECSYKMIGLIQEFQMLRKCCRGKHVQNIIFFQPIKLKLNSRISIINKRTIKT